MATGTVALVGSGEFLQGSDLLDRELLSRLTAPARVVIMPTAAAPDGNSVATRWAKMGTQHFSRLGAEATAAMVLTRQDAESAELAQQIAAANFIYLSGGKPGYLVNTLRDSACWQAIKQVYEAGGVIAGCSAGAMSLAEILPGLFSAQPALGLVKGLAVIPHFDEIPGFLKTAGRFAAQGVTVVGVEGSTGLVISGDSMWVSGKGQVTVLSRRGRRTYSSGEPVVLAQS